MAITFAPVLQDVAARVGGTEPHEVQFIAGLLTVAWVIFGLGAYTFALWLVLLLVMMRLIGWEHPPALDDDLPLDAGRLALAALVVAIMVVCFMPVPFPGLKPFW